MSQAIQLNWNIECCFLAGQNFWKKMRRQSYSASPSMPGGVSEPQIIVEESTLGEEEEEERRNLSPPRCMDPDSPSLDPYLLYPWRETRKHSLPTPQCTSGITASQVPYDLSVMKNKLLNHILVSDSLLITLRLSHKFS